MTTLRAIALLSLAAAAAHTQDNPLKSQFDRLMGQPKDVVNAIVNFPWKADPPQTIPGFHQAAPPDKLRIGSAETTPHDQSGWRHWESEDGSAWVDILTFSSPFGASQTLNVHQAHSGYEWDNQHLLFSGTADLRKEALAAALISGNGKLLNIGLKLPLEVHWDRPLPDSDRVAFDAALTRFQTTLEDLARTLLDPTYVNLGSKIEPKPEALPMLRMAGFARLWSTIKYNFVYLDRRPDVNWDGMLEEYLPRIAAAKDDAEYGRLLERAVALLRDGHTNVYPNAAERQDSPAVLLEPIGGKPVATVVGNLPELSSIKPGMELIAIDGTPSSAIIERDIDPYISSSTIQDRQLRQMRMLMEGPPGSRMRTRWLSPDGATVEATLTRNRSEHRDALQTAPHRRFAYKQLPGDVAYVELSDFSNPAADTDFDKKFDQLRTAKAWILDLRSNGGGSSDIGYKILARFIDQPVEGSTWRTRQYLPTFEAWGRPQTWHDGDPEKIEPAAGPHYQGPVYVLTSPSTCSAAEDFLIPLKISKRATIVGEPTCGSTGQPLLFSIFGATARVCTKEDRFPDGTLFVGVGVVPDVKAARTRQDVAAGRDAVLETAIALASKQSK